MQDYLIETKDAIIVGEEDTTDGINDDKPIRLLTDFTIFDPAHANALVSLDELLQANDARFEAAGKVGPVYANEEDAGQDFEAETDEARDAKKPNELDNLRTSAIVTFYIDYGEDDGYARIRCSG